MATRQYVGARYVPKIFADEHGDSQWRDNIPYEALTIVTNLGNSYTSRKPVPIGVQIDNGEYWALTGAYNSQVEQYREEVQKLKEEFDSTKTYVTPEVYGAVGDGVTDDKVALIEAFRSGYPVYLENNYATSGMIPITNSVEIYGNGSIIGLSTINTDLIHIENPDGDIDFVKISGITVNGDNVASVSDKGLIHIVALPNNKVKNVTITNCTLHCNKAINGIYLDNHNNAFTKENFQNAVVKDNIIYQCRVGIAQSRVSSTISDNYINNTLYEAITVDNGLDECIVSGNKIGAHDEVSLGAIGIDYAKNCFITDNVISLGASKNNVSYSGVMFNCNMGTSDGIIISNNIVTGGDTAYYVRQATSQGRWGGENLVFTGNHTTNTNYFMYTEDVHNFGDIVVSGNHSLATHRYGGSAYDKIYDDYSTDFYNRYKGEYCGDANTIKKSGVVSVNNGTANIPSGIYGGNILSMYGGTFPESEENMWWLKQVLFATNGNTYTRGFVGGSWQAWGQV